MTYSWRIRKLQYSGNENRKKCKRTGSLRSAFLRYGSMNLNSATSKRWNRGQPFCELLNNNLGMNVRWLMSSSHEKLVPKSQHYTIRKPMHGISWSDTFLTLKAQKTEKPDFVIPICQKASISLTWSLEHQAVAMPKMHMQRHSGPAEDEHQDAITNSHQNWAILNAGSRIDKSNNVFSWTTRRYNGTAHHLYTWKLLESRVDSGELKSISHVTNKRKYGRGWNPALRSWSLFIKRTVTFKTWSVTKEELGRCKVRTR